MDLTKTSKLFLALVIAALTFSILFAGFYFNFWLQMTCTILMLMFLAFWFYGNNLKKQLIITRSQIPFSILLGILSGIFLYFIFFIGNDLAGYLLSFGKAGISTIYEFGDGVDPRIMLFLLMFIIGPGEEIFWRGYVQKSLTREYGKLGTGFAILAYAGIHLASGNMMLIGAALVAGVFWGLLYHYYKNLWVNIISHAFWDAAVFVFWPFS